MDASGSFLQADQFLQAAAREMDLTPTSRKYAFKWLKLADAAGLSEFCRVCVEKILGTANSGGMCKAEYLQGLSPQTLINFIECLTPPAAGQRNAMYCYHCRASRIFRCTACNC